MDQIKGNKRRALAENLRDSRGALARADVTARFGEHALRACLADGTIARVLPGTYVYGQFSRDADVRVRAASAWSAPHAALTGLASVWAWGVTPDPPAVVTVQVPPHLRLGGPGWMRIVGPGFVSGVVLVNGIRTVGPADSLVQSWSAQPRDLATNLVFEAVRQRLTTSVALKVAASRTPRVRARSELLRLLDKLDEGATSFLELQAMTHVFPAARFPEIAWQVPVSVAGRRRVLDAFAADARLALEFDGARYHSGDAARLADIQRDAELATVGIQVLRFPYGAILRSPAWCRDVYMATRAERLKAWGPGPRG